MGDRKAARDDYGRSCTGKAVKPRVNAMWAQLLRSTAKLYGFASGYVPLLRLLVRPARYYIEEAMWLLRALFRRARVDRATDGGLRRHADDAAVSLFYNGRTLPRGYAIGRALGLKDGGFVRDPFSPVLRRGLGWEAAGVKDPYAVALGRDIYLFYAGSSGRGATLAARRLEYQIGLAVSSDGGETFRRRGRRPIIARGALGEWDGGGAAFPVVIYESGESDPERRWKMWYRGSDETRRQRVGLATSADGRKWTKFAGNPVLPNAGDDGGNTSTSPHAIVRKGPRYFLFTSRADGMNLATASNAEGPYEESHRNPILPPRLHAVQPLTRDVHRGEHVLTVDDTSVFQPMEFVVIHDDASEPMLTRIRAIDSFGRLTIRDPICDTFLVAGRALVRSVYCSGMGPRAVYREADHWVALVTAMPGVSLLEFAGVAVSESLEGPYTIDFRRGLVLEPDTANSKWDRHSAENFCAVAPLAAERFV